MEMEIGKFLWAWRYGDRVGIGKIHRNGIWMGKIHVLVIGPICFMMSAVWLRMIILNDEMAWDLWLLIDNFGSIFLWHLFWSKVLITCWLPVSFQVHVKTALQMVLQTRLAVYGVTQMHCVLKFWLIKCLLLFMLCVFLWCARWRFLQRTLWQHCQRLLMLILKNL